MITKTTIKREKNIMSKVTFPLLLAVAWRGTLFEACASVQKVVGVLKTRGILHIINNFTISVHPKTKPISPSYYLRKYAITFISICNY